MNNENILKLVIKQQISINHVFIDADDKQDMPHNIVLKVC